MDRAKRATKPYVVDGVTIMNIETEYRHPDYGEPEFEVDVTTTDTGRIQLARIEPAKPSLPAFSLRWDEEANTVDVDLISNDRAEVLRFKNGAPGYKGHWTKRLNDNPRTHALDIGTPAGDVYRGKIIFQGLAMGLRLSESLQVQMTCDATVIRANEAKRAE